MKAYETGQPVQLEETEKMIDGDDDTFDKMEGGDSLSIKDTKSWDKSDRTQEDTVTGVAETKETLDDSWVDHPLEVEESEANH